MKKSTIAFVLAIAVGSAAEAATIRVPADAASIQLAIAAAAPGDTVLVAPGTYVENLTFLGKAITVVSESGPAMTVIDGNWAGPVVGFTEGEPRAAVYAASQFSTAPPASTAAACSFRMRRPRSPTTGSSATAHAQAPACTAALDRP